MRKMLIASVEFHKKLRVLAAQESITVKELLEKMYEYYIKKGK